jgi:putative oxidoreductase
LQRLFTTFADGWPGLGLLLQRLLAAIVLLHYDIVFVRASSGFATVVLQIIGAGACVLLLLGLWTPLAGTLFALVELWIAVAHSRDPWISITLATLGVTLAMIGPGAWSIDARLFGRKHIDMRGRHTSLIPPKS